MSAIRAGAAMSARMLLATVFCCVSGGPFGLEPLVQVSGPGLAVALIVILPFLWALPDALVTTELATMMPVEGGYYQWVKRALGPLPAFLNGWWTYLYAIVDASLYPILFGESLAKVLAIATGDPTFDEDRSFKWLAGLVVIGVFTLVNLLGARLVGRASTLLTVLVVVPFAALGVVALARFGLRPHAVSLPFLPEGAGLQTGLAAGLGVAMWNYLGWDSLSTVAGEVEEPQRAFPFALFWGVPLVAGVYLLSVVGGLLYYPDYRLWDEGAWPAIASAVGGPALFWPVSLAALASSAGLFTATFLASSRLPFVMAEDGLMPSVLARRHPRFGTPWAAIGLGAACYAGLSAVFTFRQLVEVNVVLYATALVTEGVSLLVLRRRCPEEDRPFRIPGGFGVAALVAALPALLVSLLVGLSVAEEGWSAQVPTLIALASGPVAYALAQKGRGRASVS